MLDAVSLCVVIFQTVTMLCAKAKDSTRMLEIVVFFKLCTLQPVRSSSASSIQEDLKIQYTNRTGADLKI